MLSKRLSRLFFIQGHGANYRKLTNEEKANAEKNFFESLKNSKTESPKIYNPYRYFKDLISESSPPVPTRIPYDYTINNDKYTDNYHWMSQEINSDNLINYLQKEMIYSDTINSIKWNISKEIFDELKERTPEYHSQIIEKSGFVYHQEENRILRIQGDKTETVISKEEILSHPIIKNNKPLIEFLNSMPFYIKNMQFSHDHRFIAFCIPTEISQAIIVKDMEKGMTGFYIEDIDQYFTFDHCYGLFFITKDSVTEKGAKCIRADFNPNLTEEESILDQSKVDIGNIPVIKAEIVYEEPDRTFSVDVILSLNGKYILIRSDNLLSDPGRTAVEYRYRASNRSSGDFLIIQERQDGVNYSVKNQENFFFLLVSTPEEHNGKILKLEIPPHSTYDLTSAPLELSTSTELQGQFLGAKTHTPHSNNFIEDIEAFKDHLVSILKDSNTSLQYIQVDNSTSGVSDIVAYEKYEGQLKVANNKSYRIGLSQDLNQYYDKKFRYYLSTLHSPEQIISYDLETRQNKVDNYLYSVPGVRIEDYNSERIILSANDGAVIPVTLIYNKKCVKSGSKAMAIVQSFGSEIESSHNFVLDYAWYSLLDRGFLWVIPHIRGSIDLNKNWYDLGVQENKIRHLQDFLDVIVSLVSEKIVENVSGYSCTPSGGLTLASLVVKEPNILTSVVMRNPILDVFDFIKDKRTVNEFGDARDIKIYETIRSFSPYHQRFPSEFCPTMICADYDHECAFQAIKFTAKCRENKDSKSVIYKEYPTWTQNIMKQAEELAFLASNSKLR